MHPSGRAPRILGRLRLSALAAVVVATLAITLASPSGIAQAEDANGFPTWQEVEAARGNVTAQQQKITEIKALIDQLVAEQAAAELLADQKAAEAADAQERLDQAQFASDQLQQQATDAQTDADASRADASQLAAQLARSGGTGDLSVELFANPGSADDWLYRMSVLDASASNADSLYTQAQQDANTAQSLQDQASVARDERQRLSDEANAAFEAATAAADAAAAAVQRTNDNKATLEAQLSVLVENRAATEADYNAGQAWYAEQARIKAEREAEERRQREAAAEKARQEQAARGGGGGGSSGGSDGGGSGGGYAGPGVSASGWTSPHYGRITSLYGIRTDPVTGAYTKLHAGLDIAAGTGTPVYSAADGVVALRGRDGYGANFIFINHAGGYQTRYYHFMKPSTLAAGTVVKAGDVVGYEGATGHVTGPHLHFELRTNGGSTPINPLPFLRGQGVNI